MGSILVFFARDVLDARNSLILRQWVYISEPSFDKDGQINDLIPSKKFLIKLVQEGIFHEINLIK